MADTEFDRPPGSLQLARRTIHANDAADAYEAALALCRACPTLDTVPKLIAEWFEGQLSTTLFDRLADAHHQVHQEREFDQLMEVPA